MDKIKQIGKKIVELYEDRQEITTKELRIIIKINVGLDERTIKKYIDNLVEFGFVNKINDKVYKLNTKRINNFFKTLH
jgi:predicted HTH transcriptional regulator